MSDNTSNGGGLGILGLIIMGILGLCGLGGGYVVWKKSQKIAYENGKAQGYKEASEEYEAKFRQQAEEFLSKIKEFKAIIEQHKEEKKALIEKINGYLEAGARLIGAYEGLKKRYDERNKKVSADTEELSARLTSTLDKLDEVKKAA